MMWSWVPGPNTKHSNVYNIELVSESVFYLSLLILTHHFKLTKAAGRYIAVQKGLCVVLAPVLHNGCFMYAPFILFEL
jgi:hypothetical protein